MQQVIISILGKDKPGIVDDIARLVMAEGGSWQQSQFAQMAGHFAGFVEVSIDDDKASAFLDAITQIDEIKIQALPSQHAQHTDQQRRQLVVTGNDKPGIVAEVSSTLRQFDINIDRMSSRRTSAPNWGSDLFHATIDISLGQQVDIDELTQSLEAIGDDFIVDIQE